MSQPVTLVSSRPTTTRHTISSGPMSEGMINVLTDQQVRRQNDSTERVCMFSVCLMFIGIPIIVVGIVFLSFVAPVGVVLMIIGVVASSSGAFLAILSAILSIFTKTSSTTTTPANYTDGQTPDITIEGTNYSEDFEDNLCEEPPQQLSVANLSVPNDIQMPAKLDPVYWSNYPEAQNPKSYLSSFGDLPKVIPSPDPSVMKKKSHKKGKNPMKYDEKIKRKLSKTIKMGVKRRTLSRTELTRDFSQEIYSSSSSSSSPVVDPKASYYKISSNDFDVKLNESIITIENFALNMSDENVSEVMINGIDTDTNGVHKDNEPKVNDTDISVDSNHIKQTNNKNNTNNNQLKGIENNSFSDECEKIEMIEKDVGLDMESSVTGASASASGDDFDKYDNLWNTVREQHK